MCLVGFDLVERLNRTGGEFNQVLWLVVGLERLDQVAERFDSFAINFIHHGPTGQAYVSVCLLYTSPSPRDRG